MNEIIMKSMGFVFMVLLGTFSRRTGIITKEDSKILSKIAMTFTLPCALTVGFNGVSFTFWMVICFLCGILVPAACAVTARITLSKGKTPHEIANNMICCCGYNGGSFAIPFCQSFFPASAIGYLIMFDMGNSIMAFGGAGAFGGSVLDNGGFNGKKLVKKLFSSVPFCVYMVLMCLSLFGIRLPDVVIDFITPVAQANIFLMMFNVGVQIELNVDRSIVKDLLGIFAVRMAVGAVFGTLIFLLPADILMQQVLTIIAFAPLCTPAVIWSQDLECDTRVPAMACSLGILVGIVTYIALLIIML